MAEVSIDEEACKLDFSLSARFLAQHKKHRRQRRRRSKRRIMPATTPMMMCTIATEAFCGLSDGREVHDLLPYPLLK